MKHIKIYESKKSEESIKDAVTEYQKIGNFISDFIAFENPDAENKYNI